MKKLITYNILCALLVGAAVEVSAQQATRHSNYLFNKLIINPAAAGSNDYIELMAGYRKNWVGFQGLPRTFFFSADGSALQKRVGLGIQVVNEEMGAFESTGITGSVASRIRVARENYLSFGFSAGYFANTMNGTMLGIRENDDIAIPATNEQIGIFDFRAGIYYKDPRNFGGVSVFNVLEPVLNYTGNQRQNAGVAARHYYAFAGRIFRLNSDLDLIPSLLYKFTEEGNDQLDINLRAMYQNRLGLGLSVRGDEAVSVLAEFFPTEFLRMGYAYDFTFNELSRNNSGSHEIMVAYRIIQNKRLTENPRYLFN